MTGVTVLTPQEKIKIDREKKNEGGNSLILNYKEAYYGLYTRNI